MLLINLFVFTSKPLPRNFIYFSRHSSRAAEIPGVLPCSRNYCSYLLDQKKCTSGLEYQLSTNLDKNTKRSRFLMVYLLQRNIFVFEIQCKDVHQITRLESFPHFFSTFPWHRHIVVFHFSMISTAWDRPSPQTEHPIFEFSNPNISKF